MSSTFSYIAGFMTLWDAHVRKRVAGASGGLFSLFYLIVGGILLILATGLIFSAIDFGSIAD